MSRRRRILLVVLVAVAGAAAVTASGIFPWSPLNCWSEEIDIVSGRIRRTRYLYYCCIWDEVVDSWMTRALPNSDAPPDWKRVNTFSPGTNHSPHYLYHSAIHQLRTIDVMNELVPFDADAKRQAAVEISRRWRQGSDQAADDWLDKLNDVVLARHEAKAALIQRSDLP